MWIPSRGVNGEYGYLNTETGKFRTTLPNSKEEKLKEQLKLRKAALVTHSARQAKYERTDAKRRNHSDETVKKQIRVPIITMNPDGTFTNNYILLMAPNESSLSTHDPIAEFYIGAKALNPVFNLLGKGYTYGMARIGNNYARAKIISNELNKSLLNLNSPVIPLNIGWGPKQTFKVSHASNDGNMLTFFPKRWDVINEGTNPHGIWFQGKLGYPRTYFTNPGKGEKAAKARALFANRSMQTLGDLTLEKPMITVGDVPNRSLLSYYADNAGADGLIYNGVYDNGYNNNLVILSFKKMDRPNGNPFTKNYKFTSFDLSSPLKNGLWDIPTITLLIKEGGSKAVDFLGSQTRLDTYNYNRNLANRLGFGSIEEPYNSIVRVRKPFQVKFNTNTLSNEGGSFIPGKTALLDIVEINLTHDIEPAAFHETLHRGSYGMGSLEGLDNMSEFRNTNRFYEYLSDKLKKPWSSLPTSMRDYLDKPGELPVNVLELGLRMGIQVGLKYPGKTKFNTIIELFKKANPNDGKLFILDYLNMDKPKRVWNALSGLYFTALPAIYGGYKATEE